MLGPKDDKEEEDRTLPLRNLLPAKQKRKLSCPLGEITWKSINLVSINEKLEKSSRRKT